MRPVIVAPGEGKEVCAFGDTIQFKVVGASTGNDLTIAHATTPPGGGPPPHIHHNEHEVFILETGDLELLIEGEWQRAVQGSVVFLPKGVPHTFRNPNDTPSRMWVIVAPSGFESFFEKCAAVFDQGGEPDIARILQTCAEHGLEILAPPQH